MKYWRSVYEDLKDYFMENYHQVISNEDIDNMSNKAVLGYWLEWNGIIGYTNDIIEIMEAKNE